jgi:hypothetical protein
MSSEQNLESDAGATAEADQIAATITRILVEAFVKREGREPSSEEVAMLLEELTEERINELFGSELQGDDKVSNLVSSHIEDDSQIEDDDEEETNSDDSSEEEDSKIHKIAADESILLNCQQSSITDSMFNKKLSPEEKDLNIQHDRNEDENTQSQNKKRKTEQV